MGDFGLLQSYVLCYKGLVGPYLHAMEKFCNMKMKVEISIIENVYVNKNLLLWKGW